MEQVPSRDIERLRQWHEDTKKADVQRNLLIEELLMRIDEMQKTIDRSSFVFVLIDGDGLFFLNDLVKQGDPGGDEAAKLLRKSVFKDLQYDNIFTHNTELVIRVYANTRGLSNAYVEKGILPNPSAFYGFTLGFNKAHPLCDFIDAGDHEESTAAKLIETLRLYSYNAHCKHIIFGASLDDRYASILTNLSVDAEVSSRIRIVKGTPFPREFRTLLSRFKRTAFPNVFRDEGLVQESTAWCSSHWTPGGGSERSLARVPLVSSNANSSSIHWPRNERASSEISKVTTEVTVDSSSKEVLENISLKVCKIYQNSKGQRIDIPIELQFERQVLYNMRSRPKKLCKRFYLANCRLGDRCTFDHSSVLSQAELAALTYMARCKPCSWGSDCVSADCISGHICPYPDRCVPENCKFQGMHDIDTKVTNTIPAR